MKFERKITLSGVYGWLAGALTTYTLGSVFMTQVVLADLGDLGVAVDFALRFRTTLRDLAGLATSYLPLVAIATGIAFLVAAFAARLIPAWRRSLIILAGLLAPGALLGIMSLVLGMNPLAGAAGPVGLALQMLAGATGAAVYLGVVDGRR